MPIVFKSSLSSSVANATFLDKTIDDLKKGKLGLYKISTSEPEYISDVQEYINFIAATDGISEENDALAKTYSSEQIISNGDDRKVAIGKLDAQVKTNLDNITQAQSDIITNTNNIATNTSDISDIQTLISNGSIKLKSYVDDTAYEAENGTPTGGEIYWNTTDYVVRVYNESTPGWDDIQGGGAGDFVNVGIGAGVFKQINTVPEVELRSIKSGYNIAVTELTDEIQIDYVGGTVKTDLNWYTNDLPPLFENSLDGMVLSLFDYQQTQSVFVLVKVPDSYKTGSQIVLGGGFCFANSTATNVLFKSTSKLIDSSYVLDSGFAHTHTSTNTEITLSATANEIAYLGDIDLTNGTGFINTHQVVAGDKFIVEIKRIFGSETIPTTTDAKLVLESFELIF